MVSKRELEYANQPARYVPFPGLNYAYTAAEMLTKAYETYQKNYQNKKYSFIFSNGEEIDFQIFEKNLAHLFGLDYKTLITPQMSGLVNDVLGLEPGKLGGADIMLGKIIERIDDVIKNDSKLNSSNSFLNYYRVLIKCTAFSNLSTFEHFNFGCLNFDKSLYVKPDGTEYRPYSNKFFFVPSNEAVTPYFMMGILPNNGSDIYIPETIFAANDFGGMINNQTFLVPIQILINDNYELNKIVATPKEKLDILNLYKTLIAIYQSNTFIDIYNDYENTLRENKELKLR